MASSDVTALTRQAQSLSLSSYAPRPDKGGKRGRTIKVRANHYAVTFSGQWPTVHHYDVELSPDKSMRGDKPVPKGIAKLVFVAFSQLPDVRSHLAGLAFDGRKNAYSQSRLPFENKVFSVTIKDPRRPTDELSFNVAVKLVGQVQLAALDAFCKAKGASEDEVLSALMALQVLLRVVPSQRYLQQGAGGNRFFSLNQRERIPLPYGAELARGFFQSMRPTISGLGVNLDTAYTAFVKGGPGVEVALAILGKSGNPGGFSGRGRGRGGPPSQGTPRAPPATFTPYEILELKRKLRGAEFTVEHGKSKGRIYKIDGFTDKGAADTFFELDRSTGPPSSAGRGAPASRGRGVSASAGARTGSISVAQYFQQTYNLHLKHPGLPLVIHGKRNKIPLEQITILPNHPLDPFRLAAEQTSKIILEAAKLPRERKQVIDAWRQELNHNDQPGVKAWNVQVADQMSLVDARILPAPTVLYAQGKRVEASRTASGGWDLRGLRFTKPPPRLTKWAILDLSNSRDQDIKVFVEQLINGMRTTGVDAAAPHALISRPVNGSNSHDDIRKALIEAALRAAPGLKEGKDYPQLILICLRDRSKANYEQIKRIAAMALPKALVSQCFQSSKLREDRGMPQYSANIAMKICCKLGGSTQGISREDLPLFNDATMIVGADVTHPPGRAGSSKENETNPSVAAVVASQDGTHVSYNHQIRLQLGREEVIQDLDAMMVALIKNFETKSKKRPQSIVFFRDGVSEGQYSTVLEREAQSIRKACASIDQNYKPKLTLAICGKRHHTRFFAENPNDTDKSGNLLPGTVVDTGVTHPFAFDFFLQSHSGLKGTAKPTHYIVLINENGYTSDTFQRMVHSLCFTFQRATRSVSLVPPCYYADILAGACRAFVYTDDAATTVSGSDAERQMAKAREQFPPMKIQDRINGSEGFARGSWYM